MSDKQEASKGGWFKAVLGTAAGLLSGAAAMYVSPVLDKVVKPGKPVANFAVEHDGLTATFHNRSTGARTGWWDFGDGSPLEPVTDQQDLVTHTYAHSGDYNVKLAVRNLLGDENERTVLLRLDTPRSLPPEILSLDAYPVSAGSYAPATFRVISKVKNAQVCVWDLDDDRPLEIVGEAPASQDRLVTFTRPGGYIIKLAAVNGSQAVEKSEIVNVLEAPSNTVTVVLSVTDQATRVESLTTPVTLSETFPPTSKDELYRVVKQAPARPGFEIVDVRIRSPQGSVVSLGDKLELVVDPASVAARGARNLKLVLAADRRSVRLSGELLRQSKSQPANVTVPLQLVQQKRTPVNRPAVPVAATLAAPGSAMLMLPPLPSDWTEPRRQYRLEVRDGDRVLWQESGLTRGSTVMLNNRRFTLSAVPLGDQIRVDLAEVRPGTRPTAN